MTRPLPGPPERLRPLRRRSFSPLHAAAASALAALAVAGCIGGETVDQTTPSPIASSAAPSVLPSSSASTSPTSAPPSATAEPTAEPTESATPSATEDPSASGATADVCTGTDDNRSFFADAAERFAWPVYCGVLTGRWNVITGSFSGAEGGSLDISYRGPNGATLSLRQGASCARGDGCPLSGTEAGDAPFGDQTGRFIQLDDGGWAVVVDRGANPSWVAVGTAMDEATFRSVVAELARLD